MRKNRPYFILLTVLTAGFMALLWPRIAAAGGSIGGGSCNQAALQTAIDSGGTVTFTADCTITVSSPLQINTSVTLDGAGSVVVLSGGNITRVLTINSGSVTLNGLTIRDGLVTTSDNGSGIKNSGFLTLTNSAVIDNAVTGGSFFDDTGFGGGIFLADGSELVVINSTISGNTAKEGGGGIAVASFGTADISLSFATVVSNTETSGLGAGGIEQVDGELTTFSSLIAYNFSDDGQFVRTLANTLGSVTTLGYNMSDTNLAGTFPTTGDQFDVLEPGVLPLADNGGATPTHGLLASSPAVDGGAPAGPNCLAADQRGTPRPNGGACDAGAFEYYTPLVLDGTLAGGLTLSWNANGNSGYIVTRSSSPFSGHGPIGTTGGTTFAPTGGNENNPAVNDYYRIVGQDFNDASQPLGVFTFAVVPGS